MSAATSVRALAIPYLFARRCPSAVFELVIPVVVDAIKRITAWSFTHIRQKIIEDQPTLTNGNTSAPIMCPSVTLGVGTSYLHGCPRFVGRRHSVFPRVPVSQVIGLVSLQTSATVLFPFDCGTRRSCNLRSTVADKLPPSVFFPYVRERYGAQASKSLTREIEACGHV